MIWRSSDLAIWRSNCPIRQIDGSLARQMGLLAILATPAASQQTNRPPAEGGIVYQLGMPPVWKGTAGASFGWYRPGEDNLLTFYGHAGLQKDLMSPIVGVAALNFEGYGGYRGGGDFDGGVRGLFMIPSFRIGAGVD